MTGRAPGVSDDFPFRSFLESLFANAQEGVLFTDEHHRILRVNEEFERLFGYTAEEVRGRIIDDFIAPPDLEEEARGLSSAVEAGEQVTYETRRRRRDGSEFDVSILGGPVVENGETIGIFAIYRDISDRTRAEAALRKSEARYRDIFEQAPIGIFQTHCDGRPLRVNGTIARILGYESASELMSALEGSAYNVYAHEGVRDHFLSLLKEHGAVSNFRYEARRRDGGLVTLSETSRISEWRSEDDFVIDGFIFDITELRRAQREVTRKERRLQGIFDAARDMALILAESGDDGEVGEFRVAEFSAGAERMLQYRSEDVLGSSLLDLHPEADRDEMTARLRSVADERQEINEELVLVAQDGTHVPVLFTAHPVLGPGGRVIGIVEVAVDIGERKRAEEAIESSLREKEVLLQEIHHRVKNNMQIISSILSLEIGHLEDPGVRQALQVSQNRIRSMALIHEKLYQSRDLARVDLSEYIADLCTDLRSMSEAGSSVTFDLDTEAVHAGVDFAIPFGLIVNELVTNAMKHARPEQGDPVVTVRLDVRTEGTVLVVADNGPGFPAGFTGSSGSSLGMELVSSLISQLRGSLEYAHEQGAVVRVTVPPPGRQVPGR